VREAELLITSGTLIGCVVLVIWRARPRVQVWGLSAALLLVAPLVYAWTERLRDDIDDHAVRRQQPADRTRRTRSPWSSSKACKGCHPGAHETWQQTYHRRMTQRASPDAVLARWEGTVTDEGRTYRLFREGARFFVDMPRYGTRGGPSERMVRPMVLTTGSHHQQLYWITVPWSETEAPPGSEALYARLCAKCHGDEGWGAEAGPLKEQDLLLEGIDEVLRDPGHRALVGQALSEDERIALGELVRRMQHDDRLMQFPLAWMVKEQRWVNEEHTFLHPEPPALEREPFQEGWSNGCDQCHAVAARFNAGPLGASGRAEVAELGIACEACHGPGARHVQRYSSPLTRYAAHFDQGRAGSSDGDIINPADLDPARSAAVCAQCHAETWPLSTPVGRRFRPGDRLEDLVRVVQLEAEPLPEWLFFATEDDPELLASGFWKDGTIRIAGRDYNGLVISPCHAEGGLTCISCHQMHGSDPNDQLADGALRGRDACGKCHEAIAADPAAHSHHPANSPGSDCYNCHMPRTTYGLLTVMRAHRIDSPSVEQSLRGRPNACNLCHLDKTLAEVGKQLTDWYGHPTAVLDSDAPAAAVDWLIAGDAVQRAIVAWHAGWQPAREASGDWWLAPLLAELLDDPYASVRFLAGQSLEGLPGMMDVAYDYTGPPEQRIEAARRALDAWKASGNQRGRSLPSAFIEDGALRRPALVELEAQRDDRPVTVNE
jgi:hypothetical protein